jgi:hypothetical protein
MSPGRIPARPDLSGHVSRITHHVSLMRRRLSSLKVTIYHIFSHDDATPCRSGTCERNIKASGLRRETESKFPSTPTEVAGKPHGREKAQRAQKEGRTVLGIVTAELPSQGRHEMGAQYETFALQNVVAKCVEITPGGEAHPEWR